MAAITRKPLENLFYEEDSICKLESGEQSNGRTYRHTGLENLLDSVAKEERKAQESFEGELLEEDGVAPAELEDLEVLCAESCEFNRLGCGELQGYTGAVSDRSLVARQRREKTTHEIGRRGHERVVRGVRGQIRHKLHHGCLGMLVQLVEGELGVTVPDEKVAQRVLLIRRRGSSVLQNVLKHAFESFKELICCRTLERTA